MKRLICLLLGHKPNLHSITVADEQGPITVKRYTPMVFSSKVDPGFSVYPCLRCKVLVAVVNIERIMGTVTFDATVKGESD